jgi:hypothetical protein
MGSYPPQRLAGGVARIGGVGCRQGRLFFFEKKNQKTLVPWCHTMRRLPVQTAPKGAKVFWFFFSKKNTFLP